MMFMRSYWLQAWEQGQDMSHCKSVRNVCVNVQEKIVIMSWIAISRNVRARDDLVVLMMRATQIWLSSCWDPSLCIFYGHLTGWDNLELCGCCACCPLIDGTNERIIIGIPNVSVLFANATKRRRMGSWDWFMLHTVRFNPYENNYSYTDRTHRLSNSNLSEADVVSVNTL